MAALALALTLLGAAAAAPLQGSTKLAPRQAAEHPVPPMLFAYGYDIAKEDAVDFNGPFGSQFTQVSPQGVFTGPLVNASHSSATTVGKYSAANATASTPSEHTTHFLGTTSDGTPFAMSEVGLIINGTNYNRHIWTAPANSSAGILANSFVLCRGAIETNSTHGSCWILGQQPKEGDVPAPQLTYQYSVDMNVAVAGGNSASGLTQLLAYTNGTYAGNVPAQNVSGFGQGAYGQQGAAILQNSISGTLQDASVFGLEETGLQTDDSQLFSRHSWTFGDPSPNAFLSESYVLCAGKVGVAGRLTAPISQDCFTVGAN